MASRARRWRWFLLHSHFMRDFWLICFIACLFCGMMYVIVSVRDSRVDDGTHIDLSPARQRELIEEWKIEKQNKPKLEVHYESDDDMDEDARELSKSKNTAADKPKNNNGHVSVVENPSLSNNSVQVVKAKPLEDVLNMMLPKPKHQTDNSIGNLEGGFAECRLYDLEDEADGDFECLQMDMKPDVTVCIYPVEQDVHVSNQLRSSGMWEAEIVKQFQNILYADPDLSFIDVGAHIGMYSLIAGNMNRQVVSVEPWQSNLERLHKAVKLSGLEDRVVAIRNVISDHRKMVSLMTFKDNQGGTQISKKEPCFHVGCMPSAKSIHMDDLLEVAHFNKAVMKIDIEGHEHLAFRHSLKFLHKIYIPYIFMEWRILRSYYGSEMTESDDKDLAGWMVDYLSEQGYVAHSSITGIQLNPRIWYGWPDDIIWKHEMRDFN